MLAALTIDPHSSQALWRQIEDGMRRLVASGSLAGGTPVLSVRELASELEVNPATVAKAYRSLCDEGILEVRRGEGTFVADRSDSEIEEDREELLDQAAREFVEVAVSVGASRFTALEAMARVWDAVAEQTE